MMKRWAPEGPGSLFSIEDPAESPEEKRQSACSVPDRHESVCSEGAAILRGATGGSQSG